MKKAIIIAFTIEKELHYVMHFLHAISMSLYFAGITHENMTGIICGCLEMAYKKYYSMGMDEKEQDEIKYNLNKPDTSEDSENEEKRSTRPRYVYGTFKLLKRNFWSFLRFEILYKLIGYFAFYPLMQQFENIALKISKVWYLSDYNLGKVLKNPFTWLTAVIVIFLTGTFITVEFFGLSSGIHASYSNVKITARDMLNDGIAMAKELIHPGSWMFILYVYLILPIADFYDIINSNQNFSVPSYLTVLISKKGSLKALAFIIIIIGLYFSLRWIYVIPEMVIMRRNFMEAKSVSARLMKKRIFRSILSIAGWIIIIAGILTGLFLGGILLVRFVISWLDIQADPTVATSSVTTLAIESILMLLTVLIVTPLALTRIQVGFYFDTESSGDIIPEYKPSHHIIKQYILARVALWTVVCVCIYFFVPPRYEQIRAAVADGGRGTMVMAHRGDSVSAPENTLPAFQKAIDKGADAIELDVQMTKDGTIIVLHDSSLKRTTGVNKKVWEVTYDEIKNLDNGSFYSSQYKYTTIPKLDRTLKYCKGKAYLNIEIKRTGHDDGIVEKTLEIIAANHFENECDITSQDYETLEEVKKLNPDIYTVYTTRLSGGMVTKLKAADAFSIQENSVNAGLVRYLRKNGKGIYVWTVDDSININKMLDLNVDAIITNNVSLAENLMYSNRGTVGVMQRIQRVLLSI